MLASVNLKYIIASFVCSGGSFNATFDWEVAAKRKGYEDIRMEKITIVKEPQVEAVGAGIESEVKDVGSPIGRVRIIKGE